MEFIGYITGVILILTAIASLVVRTNKVKKEEREQYDFGEEVQADNELINVAYRGVLLPMTVGEKEQWWDPMSPHEKDAHVVKRKNHVKSGKIAYVRHRDMYVFISPEKADELMLPRERFKPRLS